MCFNRVMLSLKALNSDKPETTRKPGASLSSKRNSPRQTKYQVVTAYGKALKPPY